MKIQSVVLGAVIAAGASGAAAYELPAGNVKVVRGEVTAESKGVRRPLQVGDPVHAGERIRTAAGSSAALMLRDDTRIALEANSSVEVAKFEYNSTRQEGSALISVFRGVTAFVSGLMGKGGGDRMKIATPTATIGIRGTEFIVDVQGTDDEATAQSAPGRRRAAYFRD